MIITSAYQVPGTALSNPHPVNSLRSHNGPSRSLYWDFHSTGERWGGGRQGAKVMDRPGSRPPGPDLVQKLKGPVLLDGTGGQVLAGSVCNVQRGNVQRETKTFQMAFQAEHSTEHQASDHTGRTPRKRAWW